MASFRTIVGGRSSPIRRLSVRKRFGFAIALAALLVVGRAAAQDGTPPADQAPDGFEWGAAGALVHSPSGAMFELQYGDFVRQQNIQSYDRTAADVSVDYLWGARLALATIYVYPTNAPEVSEKMLCAEYDRCMGQVYDHKQVTEVLVERSGLFDFESESLPGHLSIFGVEEGVEFLSFLFLFVKSEWYVLYRISVPASLVEEGVVESIAGLPWAFDYGVIQ